ncbi:MAG TPA: class I SAM-dependent methyltransferase [Chitinophagaceae bacterium]|jgi:SAM-dependent methyltransferase|nr:class I SAM-dependent methyltransferase [Chitinophagaceae bacterium]
MNSRLPVSDRFTWAVSVLRPAPTDRLLEIGCGTGILLQKLAALLTEGSVTGVERSPAGIRSARARNRSYIEQGRVHLIAADFIHFAPDGPLFDKVTGFNVSALWLKPLLYLPLIRAQLRPSGSFYCFYQPPFDKTAELVRIAHDVFRRHHFNIQEVLIEPMKPAPAFCIHAVPS